MTRYDGQSAKTHCHLYDQVRWAKWSLERARVKAGRGEAGRPLEHGDVLAHQLSHFVNTLHQFVMDRLLHGAWLELQQVGITSPPPVIMLVFVHLVLQTIHRTGVQTRLSS